MSVDHFKNAQTTNFSASLEFSPNGLPTEMFSKFKLKTVPDHSWSWISTLALLSLRSLIGVDFDGITHLMVKVTNDFLIDASRFLHSISRKQSS